MILIPILLGITPLNFVQKIGAGCPFSQGKQSIKCNPCLFNFIVSQENHGITDLLEMVSESTSVHSPSSQGFNSRLMTSNIPSSIPSRAVPLRC